MNKGELFHLRNSELIQDLSKELSKILNGLESGLVIAENERTYVFGLLDSYIDTYKEFQELEAPTLKRNQRAVGKTFEEKTVLEELAGLKKSIDILIRLAREKVVEVSDEDFSSNVGQILIEKGYCEEIVIENTGCHYFVLSQKGYKSLKNKSVMSQFKLDTYAAVFPDRFAFDIDKWTNIYEQRIEMLSRYFRQYKQSAEYVAFTVEENKEMVFACELADEIDIKYVFACVFDEEGKTNDVDQIKSISGSGLIDEILLLVKSKEQQSELESTDGLDARNIKQISYFMME